MSVNGLMEWEDCRLYRLSLNYLGPESNIRQTKTEGCLIADFFPCCLQDSTVFVFFTGSYQLFCCFCFLYIISFQAVLRGREGGRERQTDRQTDRDRELVIIQLSSNYKSEQKRKFQISHAIVCSFMFTVHCPLYTFCNCF